MASRALGSSSIDKSSFSLQTPLLTSNGCSALNEFPPQAPRGGPGLSGLSCSLMRDDISMSLGVTPLTAITRCLRTRPIPPRSPGCSLGCAGGHCPLPRIHWLSHQAPPSPPYTVTCQIGQTLVRHSPEGLCPTCVRICSNVLVLRLLGHDRHRKTSDCLEGQGLFPS